MALKEWEGGCGLTCEYGACLLDVEAVVCAEDEWDGAELQVEGCPAEGYPEREEEDDWFCDEHVFDQWLVKASRGYSRWQGDIRNGRYSDI